MQQFSNVRQSTLVGHDLNVTLSALQQVSKSKKGVYLSANAAKWNIQKDRIGIMGFSAGGHLASTLLTQFDEGDKASKDSIEQQSSRPDFSVLVYPVISMTKPIMHQGSRNRLIGTNPDAELAAKYSSELQGKERSTTYFPGACNG